MQALEVDIHMGLYFTAASGAFLLPPAVLFFQEKSFGSILLPPPVVVFTDPAVRAEKLIKNQSKPPKTYMDTGEPYIDWIPAFGAYTQKRSKLLPAVECSFSAPKQLPNFRRCSFVK